MLLKLAVLLFQSLDAFLLDAQDILFLLLLGLNLFKSLLLFLLSLKLLLLGLHHLKELLLFQELLHENCMIVLGLLLFLLLKSLLLQFFLFSGSFLL